MIIPGRKALLSCLAWVAAFALVLPGVAGRDRGLQLNSHVLLYGQLNPPAGSSDPGASIHVHATVLERGGRSYESSATWSNDFPSSYSLHIPVGSTEGGGQDRTPMLSPAHEVRATATFVLNSSDCALFMEKQSHATANGFHARIDFEWNGHAASVVSRCKSDRQGVAVMPPGLPLVSVVLANILVLGLMARGRNHLRRGLWKRDDKGRLRKQ